MGRGMTGSGEERWSEEHYERLDQALAALQPEQREVIVLSRFQGLKYEEIARDQGNIGDRDKGAGAQGDQEAETPIFFKIIMREGNVMNCKDVQEILLNYFDPLTDAESRQEIKTTPRRL